MPFKFNGLAHYKRWTAMHKRLRKKRSAAYRSRKRTFRKRRRTAIRKHPGTTKTRSFTIPRLRLATTRQKSRLLKLRKDFEWTVAPEFTGVPNETLHIRIRANSVLNILAESGSTQSGLPNNVWRANDPSYIAVGGQQQYPEGLSLWQGQYYHFTVIASKVVVAINQTDGTDLHDHGVPGQDTYQPALAWITKLGTQGTAIPLGNNTTKEQLMHLPYTTMAEIHPPNNNMGTISGAKLSMGYSAKRFESVPSPLSASQLRGQLPLSPSTATQPVDHPNEQSFFCIGISPQRGYAASTTDYMQPMQLQLKVEYAVVLTEPTPTQLAGVPPGPGMADVAAAAAAAFAGAGADL